jgi:hypothetical protein
VLPAEPPPSPREADAPAAKSPRAPGEEPAP